MPFKYDTLLEKEQESEHVSQQMGQELEIFLTPLLIVLDRLLDKRLVRTFVQCCLAILRFRNSKQGLLLSELGSYLPTEPGQSSRFLGTRSSQTCPDDIAGAERSECNCG